MYFTIKILVSSLIIASVSELAKRFTLVSAVLASLPLTSILTMIWFYQDTRDLQKIMDLSYGIFWAVLPSLIFFIVLPLLLKAGVKFPFAMLISSAIMFLSYSLYIFILGKFGIKI